MNIFLLALLVFFTSCSSFFSKGSQKQGKTQYSYVDISGRYGLVRENKLIKRKLVSRVQISSSQGSTLKPLEKSIMVSQIGTIQDKDGRTLVVRPYASEFTVWLDGKRYHSKMRLNSKKKSMIVDLDSPESKWKGRSSVPFPKGKQFCFFSQIPECLYHNNFLARSQNRQGEAFTFFVVWDAYPYLQEQYSGMGSHLFTPAFVKYDGEYKKLLRFQVEVGGQTVLYHFSKSYDLVKMFWIAQGISIIPPGEEISDVEE